MENRVAASEPMAEKTVSRSLMSPRSAARVDRSRAMKTASSSTISRFVSARRMDR
jgi:hypothetical protein